MRAITNKEKIAAYGRAYRKAHKKEIAAKAKKYRKIHKEKIDTRSKTYQLKKNYNITPEQRNQMYEDQKGLCLICKKEMFGRDCNVDHDHKTGKVRGLLCSWCNCGLGNFQDNPNFLIEGAIYLKRFM